MIEEALFQIEDAFEKAFQDILTDAGMSVFRSREASDKVTPWIEVKFLVGQVTEKIRHAISDGILVYTGFQNSRLEITVTTQRQNNGDQHKILLGKARLHCQYFKLLVSWPKTEASQIHAIIDIREQPSVSGLSGEDDLDSTTLNFNLFHNIRSDAFTALTT